MNTTKVPQNELTARMERFHSMMDKTYPNWNTCAVTGNISLYYLTGTICNGVLFIIRDSQATLWVRKSFERAILESEFSDIRPMNSFRDIANSTHFSSDTLYLDMSAATLEWYTLLNKYIQFQNVLPIDNILLNMRSKKSQYEIEIMKNAGKIIDHLFLNKIPALLYTGMSEADLGADMFSLFVKNGYHGVTRFSMKNTEVVIGHIGFAESSLYPSVFNGASGLIGLCPAAPVLGSRDIKLKEGNLIYIDVGFGMDGYHVDKTMVYSFRNPQDEYVNDIHSHCLELERQAASMMNPGTKPSEIFNRVTELVKPELRDCFMGVSGNTVQFLGHGVGLYVDEQPVIAKGFDQPLECGMTMAVEPKIGVKGVGMVGSENTYLITESGAISLTGATQNIIVC